MYYKYEDLSKYVLDEYVENNSFFNITLYDNKFGITVENTTKYFEIPVISTFVATVQPISYDKYTFRKFEKETVGKDKITVIEDKEKIIYLVGNLGNNATKKNGKIYIDKGETLPNQSSFLDCYLIKYNLITQKYEGMTFREAMSCFEKIVYLEYNLSDYYIASIKEKLHFRVTPYIYYNKPRKYCIEINNDGISSKTLEFENCEEYQLTRIEIKLDNEFYDCLEGYVSFNIKENIYLVMPYSVLKNTNQRIILPNGDNLPVNTNSFSYIIAYNKLNNTIQGMTKEECQSLIDEIKITTNNEKDKE